MTHADLSVGVGTTLKAVCLCLSVCPQHNSKMNDPKVLDLVYGMTLGCPRSDMVLGFFWSQGQEVHFLH